MEEESGVGSEVMAVVGESTSPVVSPPSISSLPPKSIESAPPDLSPSSTLCPTFTSTPSTTSSTPTSSSLPSPADPSLLTSSPAPLNRISSATSTSSAPEEGPEEEAAISFAGSDIPDSAKPGAIVRVARACGHCKRAKARCDLSRPCERCLRTGKEESCVDSVHQKRGRKQSGMMIGLSHDYHKEARTDLSSTPSHSTNPSYHLTPHVQPHLTSPTPHTPDRSPHSTTPSYLTPPNLGPVGRFPPPSINPLHLPPHPHTPQHHSPPAAPAPSASHASAPQAGGPALSVSQSNGNLTWQYSTSAGAGPLMSYNPMPPMRAPPPLMYQQYHLPPPMHGTSHMQRGAAYAGPVPGPASGPPPGGPIPGSASPSAPPGSPAPLLDAAQIARSSHSPGKFAPPPSSAPVPGSLHLPYPSPYGGYLNYPPHGMHHNPPYGPIYIHHPMARPSVGGPPMYPMQGPPPPGQTDWTASPPTSAPVPGSNALGPSPPLSAASTTSAAPGQSMSSAAPPVTGSQSSTAPSPYDQPPSAMATPAMPPPHLWYQQRMPPHSQPGGSSTR